MENQYYIISSGQRLGPFNMETLRNMNLDPQTLVWRQGLEDWKKAADLPELEPIFIPDDSAFGAYAQEAPEPFFAMIGGQRIGPADPTTLIASGLNADTPVWRQGMTDWLPASSQPELMAALNAASHSTPPPPFQSQNNYDNRQTYGQNSYSPTSQPGLTPPTQQPFNWLPWAITATVVGFLFSCFGAIFGIIAIVKANAANTAFSIGNEIAGLQANSSAKTMTIIAFAFAVGGIFLAISGVFANLFTIVGAF